MSEDKKFNFHLATTSKEPVVIHLIDSEQQVAPQAKVKNTAFKSVVLTALNGILASMVKNGQIDQKDAIVIVNTETGETEVITNLTDQAHTIEAGIILNPELEKLKINKGTLFTAPEFIGLIKWYRSFFADEGTFKKLLLDYSRFQAKMQSATEQISNMGDGNVKSAIEISVELGNSDIVKNFVLEIPVIRGGKKVPVPVEIGFDGTQGRVDVYLESVVLKEMLDNVKRELIEKAIEEIRAQQFTVLIK
jgi:hypothetical protein